MAPGAAEQTVRAVIDLGRYAEVFVCDDHTHVFMCSAWATQSRRQQRWKR
jgi:hypothetical protein